MLKSNIELVELYHKTKKPLKVNKHEVEKYLKNSDFSLKPFEVEAAEAPEVEVVPETKSKKTASFKK